MAFEDAQVKCLQELARAQLQDLESLVRVQLQDLESLAPIRWLLTEVLAEIFKASLPENIEDLSFTPKTSPLVLAHVSRCWCQVVFSTPDLWSSVYINGHNKAQCPPPHVLGEWLDHSASYPLTIKAILDPSNSDTCINCSPRALRFIPILFSKSQRWEDVELVSSQLNTVPIDNQPFPMLRSLRLKTEKRADRWIHFTEENAPHLSKVFLQSIWETRVFFSMLVSAAVLPYTQLTHYRGPAYREENTKCVLTLMPGCPACSMGT
ncbi:hypothetical protein FISHEDRAFT_73758 [Fistulina hepatica ATCC 64428]|uniref:Uncharacterized protein n=1 Tax=Fistulina hepatica ATCC 64428 TaxID=1128425 RepID=A0A0D7AB04_9AGAR|nr:hypothetical protein FISHEDRAFT_73758 [Fistulina hepatica ATCC 64428]